jgi:alpha-ribazole phosphatase
MSRVLLACHAVTDANDEKRYQGQSDLPLNARGREQAERMARRLAHAKIERIFTSDLTRAQQTAQAIAARHNITPLIDPRLRELDFGAWEGRTFAEVDAQDALAMKAWLADPTRVPPPEGETLADLAARVQSFWQEHIAPFDSGTLVVSHRGALRVLVCQALGLPPEAHWRFLLEPASLWVLHPEVPTFVRYGGEHAG